MTPLPLITAHPVRKQFHGCLDIGAAELEVAMQTDPGLKTPREAFILYKWLFLKDPRGDISIGNVSITEVRL